MVRSVCVCVCVCVCVWHGTRRAKSRAGESMARIKAKNERTLQETAWRDFMAWRAQEEAQARQAEAEAKRRFALERSYKKAEAERQAKNDYTHRDRSASPEGPDRGGWAAGAMGTGGGLEVNTGDMLPRSAQQDGGLLGADGQPLSPTEAEGDEHGGRRASTESVMGQHSGQVGEQEAVGNAQQEVY